MPHSCFSSISPWPTYVRRRLGTPGGGKRSRERGKSLPAGWGTSAARPAATGSAITVTACDADPSTLGARVAAVLPPIIPAPAPLGFGRNDAGRGAADQRSGGGAAGASGHRATDHGARGRSAEDGQRILCRRLLRRR